jgi:AraC family transcriptional regulator of adaptative response / DNA-3-methyladenine glycosylase II
VETTDMSFADVAFAAGFASIRQFNETVRDVYASSPTQLRGRVRAGRASGATRATVVAGAGSPTSRTSGHVELRLPVRAPYAGAELLRFLAAHLVPGIERSGDDWYERTLDLPHGPGRVRLVFPARGTESGTTHVRCALAVEDLRDVGAAVERCRRLLDADCDPLGVDDGLADDPMMAALVRTRPGLRVPGSVDGNEVAVRAVLGQQISLAGAISLTRKLVVRHGVELPADPSYDGPTRLFPRVDVLAGVDPEELPMPRARGRALVGLCEALAGGDVRLDRSADRGDVRRQLLALPGIGPWTADYIALRALGDPDVMLPTDVGVRRALGRLGVDPASAGAVAGRWRPWRSYGLLHLWSTLDLLAAPASRTADPTHPITERN